MGQDVQHGVLDLGSIGGDRSLTEHHKNLVQFLLGRLIYPFKQSLKTLSGTGAIPSRVITMADIEKSEIQHHEASEPRRDSIEETVAEARKAGVIDTVHKDEAMKVLATYEGDLHWTEQEEKVLARKIDFKLLPMLVLTYGLQYYDKAMLAQAVSSDRLYFKTKLIMDRLFSDL